MKNNKLKTNTLYVDTMHILNQKPYTEPSEKKEDIYPRSQTLKNIVLAKKEIEKMELGKNIVIPGKTENK